MPQAAGATSGLAQARLHADGTPPVSFDLSSLRSQASLTLADTQWLFQDNLEQI